MSEIALRRSPTIAAAVLSGIATAWLALRLGLDVSLLKEAAKIDDSDKQAVAGLVRVAKAVETPALVVAASLVPLVLIGGGLLLLVGSRRGMQFIGAAAIGVALLASVGGLSA